MKLKYSRLFISTSIVAAALGTAGMASAADLFWNSNTSGNWDTTTAIWAGSSGTTPTSAWIAGEAAVFDQAATYTATLTEATTASAITVSGGNVTIDGAFAVTSPFITVSSGAVLSADPLRFILGTPTLTVNGTLNLTASAAALQRTGLNGSGTLDLAGNFRIGAPVDFSGNITGAAGSLITETGSSIILSGTNTYAGDTLIRNGNTLRLASVGALPAASKLRLSSGTALVVELAADNFSRTFGGAAGDISMFGPGDAAGNNGFAAVGADRTLALAGAVWGSTYFNPTSLILGSAASTHKVTLTTGIDLGEAVRSLNTIDGPAAVEGEISGVLSGATVLSGIKKIGSGVLTLTADNTFTGPVQMDVASGRNTGWLRLAHSNALGPNAKTITLTGSTGGAKGGIQLVGGVTVSNKGIDIGGRNSGNTFLENVSGENSWGGTIRISGPGGSYFMESKADTLTLSGTLFNNVTNSTRSFVLLGAGNYLLSGTVKNNSATLITGLVQSGSGTTTLAGTNHTYSGPTSITAGKIALASGATLANSSPIDVNGGTFDVSAIVGGWTLGAAQTLSGTSNVVGAVIANGTVSPATAAVGNLSFSSDLTLNAASTYAVSVAADGLTHDKVLVTGNLIANGTINVSLNGYVPVEGYQIDIADAAAISGTPTVPGNSLSAGLGWDTSSFTTSGIIKVVSTGGGPFISWAAANGLTVGNSGANMDPDFDSVSNLVEFVLGGQPNPANPNSNSTGLLPMATTPGGNLVFTFIRHAQAKISQVELTIRVGTDLMTFPDIYTVGNDTASSTFGVTVTPSGANDLITLTIPRSPDTKKFARLNAVYTAP